MSSTPSMSQPKVSSPKKRQENFEQAVALSLHLWPALTVAVQNSWSANDAEDVRDWFCGCIIELFPSFVDLARKAAASGRPDEDEEPDAEHVEARLLQVMADEYQVVVEDGSAFETAGQIVRLRAECAEGRFQGVNELRLRYDNRKGKKIVMQQAPEEDQNTDWESASDDEDDEDEEMSEAPALVSAPKEKPPPEVDEDGFTKVASRKKR